MSKFTKKEIAGIVGLCILALIALGLAVYIYQEENTFPSAEEARIQTEKVIQETEKQRKEYCSNRYSYLVRERIKNAIKSGKEGAYVEVADNGLFGHNRGFNCDAELKYFLQQIAENQGYTYKLTKYDGNPAYYISWD